MLVIEGEVGSEEDNGGVAPLRWSCPRIWDPSKFVAFCYCLGIFAGAAAGEDAQAAPVEDGCGFV